MAVISELGWGGPRYAHLWQRRQVRDPWRCVEAAGWVTGRSAMDARGRLRRHTVLTAGMFFAVALVVVLAPLLSAPAPVAAQRDQNLEAFPDPSGVVRTFSTRGAIDPQ